MYVCMYVCMYLCIKIARITNLAKEESYKFKKANNLVLQLEHIYIYIYIYKQIQVIHRWIQNSAQQLRSGLTVNRLLNMSTYGF